MMIKTAPALDLDDLLDVFEDSPATTPVSSTPAAPKENWVNDVLDKATQVVRAMPEWMQRPEVRSISPRTPPTPSNRKNNLQALAKQAEELDIETVLPATPENVD